MKIEITHKLKRMSRVRSINGKVPITGDKPMNTYRIDNTVSGTFMGTFEGTDEHAALEAMARDAGYSDYADACEVAPTMGGELVVSDVTNKIDEVTEYLIGKVNVDPRGLAEALFSQAEEMGNFHGEEMSAEVPARYMLDGHPNAFTI